MLLGRSAALLGRAGDERDWQLTSLSPLIPPAGQASPPSKISQNDLTTALNPSNISPLDTLFHDPVTDSDLITPAVKLNELKRNL